MSGFFFHLPLGRLPLLFSDFWWGFATWFWWSIFHWSSIDIFYHLQHFLDFVWMYLPFEIFLILFCGVGVIDCCWYFWDGMRRKRSISFCSSWYDWLSFFKLFSSCDCFLLFSKLLSPSLPAFLLGTVNTAQTNKARSGQSRGFRTVMVCCWFFFFSAKDQLSGKDREL